MMFLCLKTTSAPLVLSPFKIYWTGSSSIRFIRSKRQDVDIYDKMTIKQADRYDVIYLDIIIVYPIYRYLDRSKDPGDLEELPAGGATFTLPRLLRVVSFSAVYYFI